MPSYCTLQGARRQLEVQPQKQSVSDDTDLFFYALTAAVSIDDWTGNWFDERVLQLGFSGKVGKYNPDLYLKELPLAALDTLTNGNGDVIAPANYTLLPTGTYPKAKVRLARGFFWRGPNDQAGSTSGFPCCPANPLLDEAYAEDAIQIAGRWAYHRNYTRAWRRIALTVSGSMDDQTTTLNLSQQAGTAFDVGNILRISTLVSGATQTEQVLVTGPIASSSPSGFATSAVTVERAYNGTTPIAHDDGDPLDVWQPEPMISNCAEMAAAALYKGRNNPTGDTQVVEGFSKMIIPIDLPAKIKTFLVPYRSWRRGRP